MTVTDFNSESSYLPSLTCNMHVEFILADQLADLPLPTIKHRCLAYCYTKLDRSTPDQLADLCPHIKHRCLAYCCTKPGRSTPLIKHRCLEYCLGTAHIGRSTGRSTPHIMHLVAKNGNCRFVLLKLILADELADLPPSRSASSSEWSFLISIVKAHAGRSTGRSTLPVQASSFYC